MIGSCSADQRARRAIGLGPQAEAVNAKKRNVHRCRCVDCRSHLRSALANEHRAINRLLATLDEKNRRRLAGVLALQWGWGSIALLHQVTGLSCPTIRRGRQEVRQTELGERPGQVGRVRRTGAGRPAVEKNIPTF